MEYPALLASQYSGVYLVRLSSVEALKVRDAAQFLHILEDEPGDVDGEHRRGVVQALALRERRVGQTQRDGYRAELRRGVDVDEAVLPHDEDRQAGGADVLLRAGKDDGMFAEMRDRPRHERRRVVANEREEAAALARQEREGEGRRRGGIGRELDAVDGLVLAVIDERGGAREPVLAVERYVVVGDVVLRVPARVDRDLCVGAAETSGFVVRLFAPRAGEDVVHVALIVREIRIEQPMAREEVQHDGGELGGPTALGEEDGVGRRDLQLGPDERFGVGEKRDEFLGAMGKLGDADARIVEVE